MTTYYQTKQLYKVICRVDKAGSAYLYFTLEANGGIAFYSTLKRSSDPEHRDILIHCPIELKKHLDQILHYITRYIQIEILEQVIVQDDHNYRLGN